MGLTRIKRSKDEWTEIVDDYKQSGMSLRGYAMEKGINPKSLSNHTRGNMSLKSSTSGKRRNLEEWI